MSRIPRGKPSASSVDSDSSSFATRARSPSPHHHEAPPPQGGRSRLPQARGSRSRLPQGPSSRSEIRVTTDQTTIVQPSGTAGQSNVVRRTQVTGYPSGIPGRPSSSTAPVSPHHPPSKLQKAVFQKALVQSLAQPMRVARSSGARQKMIPPPTVMTKRGPESVLQQMVLEKVVQRSPRAEYISQYVRAVDTDPATNQARQVELTSQSIDPSHATESIGVNETVSVTSSLSVTAKGRKEKKTIKKSTVKVDKLINKVNMNPAHVNRLVREEIEDVENTIKMVPPDLASTSVDKFPLKKKLYDLRLTSTSMGLLEESVVHPPPTADEVDMETPPEVMANIINAVERGATPKSAPNQIFNTLFPDVEDERMAISPVAPGPLQDIVIPTDLPKPITVEVLTDEMEKAVLHVNTLVELPTDDIASESKVEAPKRSSKATKKSPNTTGEILEDEQPPWADSEIATVSQLVGAGPVYTVEPADVSTLETTQDLSQELSKGIDYFLDADTVPYQNKVQLRGSRLPHWFPGYMAAFPYLPEVVQISRNPNRVIHSAWKAVQPKLIADDSILIL